MKTYIFFGKYSFDAIRGLSADRTGKANKLMQKYGGEIKAIYSLLGETDLLIIADFPGMEQAMKASIAVHKLTGIAFTTSEAMAVEEFDKMISEI